jgi:AcrR family transcriptional regulator
MARRGDHSLGQIKDMVLVAAEDLIIEGGLPLLTVRKVASKIGYTVGSIYMVFDSMNDLILHIKGRALDALAEQMEQVKAPNAEQGLEELASVYIRFARQNLNRWSLIFEHRLPENTEIPDWYQNKVDNIYGKFEEQLASLIPELSTAQRRQAALVFFGGIHGMCVLMLTTQIGGLDDNDLEQSVILLTRRLIHDGSLNSMGRIAETWRLWASARPS